MTEPGGGCADYDQGLDFEMHFPNLATAGTTYHAQAVIRIDGVDIVVPFTIHTAERNGATGVRFDGARRISTQP